MFKKIVPLLIVSLLLLSCVACKMEATVPAHTMLVLFNGEEYIHSAVYQDTLPETDAEFPAVVITAEKDGKYFGEFTSPQINSKEQIGEIRITGGPGDPYMEVVDGVKFTLSYYESAERTPVVLTDTEMHASHGSRYPKYKSVKFDFTAKTVLLSNVVDR